MVTIGEIKNSIYEKLKYFNEFDFIPKEDFDSQLAEIKEHLMCAFEESKSIIGIHDINTLAMMNLDYKDERSKIFDSFYNPTNNWLGRNVLKEKHQSYLTKLFLENFHLLNEALIKYQPLWNILSSAVKSLEPENLNDISRYFINVCNDNAEFILREKLYRPPFKLLLYLISEKRIVKLFVYENGASSTEHIIQKDIKKIESRGERYLDIHYHGLHNPDTVLMDDYKSAVELRRELTDLRDRRFNSKQRY